MLARSGCVAVRSALRTAEDMVPRRPSGCGSDASTSHRRDATRRRLWQAQGHPANQDVEICILSIADRKVRTLAKLLGGRGTMNVPSWSPDSKMLAFTSYELLPQ